MNDKDKEAFEEWYSKYFKIEGITIINIPHHFTESWKAACEYMRNKSNPLDALSLYEKLETERAENKKLREALEFYANNQTIMTTENGIYLRDGLNGDFFSLREKARRALEEVDEL